MAASRRLVYPLRPDSDDISGFIEELAGPAGLSASQRYWLRLAVDEITTNIGEHGYRGGPGFAELRGRAWPGAAVCIWILDTSPPFDPLGHDRHERLAQPPGEREPGGFGLLLALARLDGFEYWNVNGYNCNMLIMRRQRGQRDASQRD